MDRLVISARAKLIPIELLEGLVAGWKRMLDCPTTPVPERNEAIILTAICRELLKWRNTMIKPTVGRVVWYHPPFIPDSFSNEVTLAAVIAKVWSDELVNLAVFDENGVAEGRTSVGLYQGDRGIRPVTAYCEWMPYQLGQAAKELQPVA